MNPSVSIILPVYNSGHFLSDAVDSVLAQSLKNFELLIVDDGSNSAETSRILASFTDSRIRILRKRNGGIASARNVGLDAASGKFIAFLDHDDLYHPDYLIRLVAMAEDSGAEITQGGFALLEGTRTLPVGQGYLPQLQKYLKKRDWRFDVRSGRFLYPLVWLQLFRRDFLLRRKLRFDPAAAMGQDDLHFSMAAWGSCSKMALVPDIVYFWRQHSGQHSARKGKILFNQLEGWAKCTAAVDCSAHPAMKQLLILEKLFYGVRVIPRLPVELRQEYCLALSRSILPEESHLARTMLWRLLFWPAIPLRFRLLETLERTLELSALNHFRRERFSSGLLQCGLSLRLADGKARQYILSPDRLLADAKKLLQE